MYETNASDSNVYKINDMLILFASNSYLCHFLLRNISITIFYCFKSRSAIFRTHGDASIASECLELG